MPVLFRYLSAVLAAAIAAATFAGLFGGGLSFAYIAFLVAIAHAFVLGVPAGLVLQRMGKANLLTAIGVGFAIGAVPTALLVVLAPTGDFASVGGVPTVVEGRRTLAGWFGGLQLAGAMGACGAVGGLGAWIAWNVSTRAPALSAIAAMCVTVAALAIPSITRDRTCHNPLRDGRNFIAPAFNAQLSLPPQDFPELTQTFGRFAAERSWSFRDSTRRGEFSFFSLSICTDEGTAIAAMQVTGPGVPALAADVSLNVYQPQGGSNWESPTRDLVHAIESRWPGHLKFQGSDGRQVERPPFLVAPSEVDRGASSDSPR